MISIKRNNKEDPKFKVGGYLRISKYKSIFVKGYVPNWSEEVFVIAKFRNAAPWKYVITILIVAAFYEKKLKKTNQKEFRREMVIKREGDKLHVKWKGYDNSFNSWINKKDIAIQK